MLYVIKCRFQITEHDKMIKGLAVCSDADTPVSFIFPDGKPYEGVEIWNYRLLHTSPWAAFDMESQV